MQPRLEPVATVNVGRAVSDDQLYTTVLDAVLLHASVAVTVNVRVMVHPLVESRCVTLVVTALQVSVAVTCEATFASVGGLVGLQPKLLPVGTLKVGGVTSDDQLYTTFCDVVLVQASAAVTVNVRVMVQPLVESR